MKPMRFKLSLLVLFMAFGAATYGQNETFGPGAYIIDMGGSTSPTVNNSLKPYGLVYQLIVTHSIPVRWAINPTKVKDGTDFVVNSKSYRGGPFIIPSSYITPAVLATINTWKTKGVIVDGPINVSFTAPVHKQLTSWPRAVLDANNDAIVAAYYTKAEVPTSSYVLKGNPTLLTGCDDIYVLPHADPQNWNASWKTALNTYIQNGGWLWAACHAVSALEANTPTYLGFRYLTTAGLTPWGSHSDGSTSSYVYNPAYNSDPMMQFIGTLNAATANGSEQIYIPYKNVSTWRPTTRVAVYQPSHVNANPNEAAVLAYGPAYGNSNSGWVAYLAGHNHDGTGTANIAAMRSYFNFILEAGIKKQPTLVVSIPNIIVSGSSITLSVNPTTGNPPFTYLWSSSCVGGSFSSPTSASTIYNAPTVNSNTECTISVRVTDNCGGVSYSSEIVIVRPPIGPTANPDNASTSFNTPVIINVLSNDTPGDTPLVPSTVTLVPGSIPPASQGVFSVNSLTGEITFTPAPLFSGTSTVQYQVCDQNNICSTALVTVVVGAPNGPTVVNDNASTPYLTPVNISVLANDIPGSTPLDPSTVTLVPGSIPPASQGVFSVNNVTGVVTFTPAVGFSGTSTVQYQVCDQASLCATGLVTVLVGPPTPPTANNDNATTNYNTAVTLNVLANDLAGSHPLVPSTVTLVAGTTPPASEGVFSVNNITGQITFTPALGFYGSSTVQYQVCDQINLCTQAVVTVLVSNPAGPIANNDNATTPYNTPVTINVLSNDTPGDSPLVPSTVTLIAGTVPPVSEGVFSVNTMTGQLTFTPAVGFSGTSTVQYIICDQLGFCDDATVIVEVGSPTGPTANNDATSTPYNTPVTIDVLANDTPGSSPLVPSSVTLVAGTTPPVSTGVFSVNNVTGWITFTPAVGFSGQATVSYQVCDQLNLCAQAVVTVTVGSPSGPTAVDDFASTPYNTPVQINVLANDIPGNSPLVPSSVTLVAGTIPPASQGVVVVNNTTGVITFVPASGFSGVSTVQYQVCDQINLCDIATVTVTIGAPSGPNAVDDNATTPYLTPVTINVLSNDTPGSTSLVPSSVTLVAGTTPPVSQGVFTVNGTTGQITFTPAAGFSGVTTVQYQVCDEINLCDIALVTVTVGAPDGPTANPDNASTPFNTPVTINVLANDTPGSTPLVPTSVTLVPGTTPPASQGVCTVNPVTGQITFTPAPGFSGTSTFQYQVCDQNNLCSTALVTVNVGSATGPTAIDDNATTQFNTPVTLDVLANDIAGSTPIVSSSVTIVAGTIPPASQGVFSVNNTTGQITFTPANGFSGTSTVQYQVCDQNNLCDQAIVTVVVGAPTGPTANNDTGTALQGNLVTIDVLANDTPGSTPLVPSSVTLVPGTLPNSATQGIFTVNPVTGAVSFNPVPTFTGIVTVQYEVCDQNNLCSIATITVTVIEGTSNLFPATGPGTLAYEDLWPAKGDYDFNDMVIDYQFEIIANTFNKVEQLIGTFTIKAFGASYENGFGFQLQSSISPTSITSVTGHQLTENIITLLSNGTEAGQSKPTFTLFDNAFALMPHPGMGIGVNTTPGAPYVTPVTLVMTINFEQDAVGINDLNIGNFNPFIIVNKVRSHEVHLPYYPPTDLANMSLFGQWEDASNPATGKYYVTANNLPWAINIYESFDYPIEKQEIVGAHLKFAAWAMSGGIQFPDWYRNLPGYRNSSLIYQIPSN
jgi:LruC domain-containing protein